MAARWVVLLAGCSVLMVALWVGQTAALMVSCSVDYLGGRSVADLADWLVVSLVMRVGLWVGRTVAPLVCYEADQSAETTE